MIGNKIICPFHSYQLTYRILLHIQYSAHHTSIKYTVLLIKSTTSKAGRGSISNELSGVTNKPQFTLEQHSIRCPARRLNLIQTDPNQTHSGSLAVDTEFVTELVATATDTSRNCANRDVVTHTDIHKVRTEALTRVRHKLSTTIDFRPRLWENEIEYTTM